MATASFLEKQKPGGTAFVIGEGGLLTALHQHGYAIVDHDPDYVVVGEGRTFNLELVEAFEKQGIAFGQPAQRIYLEQQPPVQSQLVADK